MTGRYCEVNGKIHQGGIEVDGICDWWNVILKNARLVGEMRRDNINEGTIVIKVKGYGCLDLHANLLKVIHWVNAEITGE